jgi:DNA-binding transcriptional ArsR family regulator
MGDDADRVDRTFEALASRERRTILGYVVTTIAEATTVEVLSCSLARVRADGGHDQPPSTKAVRTGLHHVHLPKLEECGLVEYDARSGTVRYQSDEPVEELVRLVSER